jgi:hypothetical protein
MEYLISMYIDNELDLNEKIAFVEKIRADAAFTDETVALLQQEKILREDPVYPAPCIAFEAESKWKKYLAPLARPIGFAACGFAAAIVFAFSFLIVPGDAEVRNRFVIYRPDITQAEIAGTFTDWKRLPMKKIGGSGYWEILLELPEGEHRFTYILEGRDRYADPTILTRETDDFGGENTILRVEGKA